jgi:hypothetical protein
MADMSGRAGEDLTSASDETNGSDPASPNLSLCQARGGVSMTTRAFSRWMAVAVCAGAFTASAQHWPMTVSMETLGSLRNLALYALCETSSTSHPLRETYHATRSSWYATEPHKNLAFQVIHGESKLTNCRSTR